MKKTLTRGLTLLLAALPLAMFANLDFPTKLVPADKLPAPAQQFLKAHFASQEVISVEQDRVLGNFEALLKDGTQVDFAKSGSLMSADAPKGKTLPKSITGAMPDPVAAYLAKNYPGAGLTEITFEKKRWEVKVENVKYELLFDKQGNYLGADD